MFEYSIPVGVVIAVRGEDTAPVLREQGGAGSRAVGRLTPSIADGSEVGALAAASPEDFLALNAGKLAVKGGLVGNVSAGGARVRLQDLEVQRAYMFS